MRIMHYMSSMILSFPAASTVPPTNLCDSKGLDIQEHEGEVGLARRHGAVQTQIGVMRARGMSNTGIRRALGLSEKEAVDAGVIPSRVEADRESRVPGPDVTHTETCGDDSQGARPLGRGGPQMAEVLAAVAGAGKVGQDEIIGTGQGRAITPLRQLTMYLLRELCDGASLPAIGHFLARDHTTVHYGCRKAKNRLCGDPDFRLLYDSVRTSLAHLTASADG